MDNIACNTRQGDARQCRAESPGRGDFKGLGQERSMDQTETNRPVGARHSNALSLWKGNSTRNANGACVKQVSINPHVVACYPF